MPTMLESSAETLAEDLGKSRKRLKNRLLEAAINDPRFDEYYYQYDEQRLLSGDRKYSLQWKLRQNPLLPISGTNPQNARGTVVLLCGGF